MIIRVNGEQVECAENMPLRTFLEGRGLDVRSVVVEHNRSVVMTDAWEDVRLTDGDELEILHFVGGG